MTKTTACTRCGSWHVAPEQAAGRRLSCTEVKRFWAEVKQEHRERFGHTPQIATDDEGRRGCLVCGRRVGP